MYGCLIEGDFAPKDKPAICTLLFKRTPFYTLYFFFICSVKSYYDITKPVQDKNVS